MQKYKFTTKTSKEAVSTTDASSTEEATIIFAKIKNLSVDDFCKLYIVSKV